MRVHARWRVPRALEAAAASWALGAGPVGQPPKAGDSGQGPISPRGMAKALVTTSSRLGRAGSILHLSPQLLGECGLERPQRASLRRRARGS